MLVRFCVYNGKYEDWTLDVLPSVGDFVRLDSGKGWVTEVAWILTTVSHPYQSVDVVVERERP